MPSLRALTKGVVVGLLMAAMVAGAGRAQADDDPIPPPLDPGPGYEGLLPAPDLPPRYVRDRHTMPYGLQSVANTPQLHMGQSFTPTRSSIDWCAFVVQNSTQPSYPQTPGPGSLKVSLYSSINTFTGALSGLLGQSNEAMIASNSTAWLLFEFPESISLTPGTTYYMHIENSGGYPSWTGIRHSNIHSGGSAFGYLYDTVWNNPPQRLNWNSYDLHFAEGVILPPSADDADFDGDGDSDGTDFLTWQRGVGVGETFAHGDADENTVVDGEDLNVWISAFDATTTAVIPEPAGAGLLAIGMAMFLRRCK